jgi:uncharacterized repeat protein (TIGR01451 family)
MNKFSSRQKMKPVIFFLGLIIVCLLLWAVGQQPSWAAPGQRPGQQTIPLRDDTPTPPPPPPVPEPTLEIPASNDEEEDKDEDEDGVIIQPGDEPPGEAPPETQPEPESVPLLPSRPIETEENSNPPVQSPEVEGEGAQNPEPALEQADIGTERNQPEAVLPLADLQLNQMVSNITPRLGEVVTFTLTLSNEGPDSATHIAISALLPPQLLLKSMMASQGSYRLGWGRWIVDTLPAGQRITLNLMAKVIGEGILTSTAEIIAVDQPDPDSVPGNALVHEDDQAAGSLLVASEVASVNNEMTTDPLVVGEVPALNGDFFSGSIPLLFWLYALILGVILFISGLLLVRYS